jgi:hypothetical protein
MGDKSKLDEFKEYCTQWGQQSWDWRWRNLVNLVDDPIDDVKHKLHGMQVLGMTFYLPPWLMKSSGKEGK